MARFSNTAIGSLSQSITQAPRPPIEIVAAADDKAGYSLTNTDAATTQIDVTLVSGQELTLVNNGGSGYTAITNSGAFTEVVNQQTGQGSQTLPNLGSLTITTTVVDGQITRCIVGDNVGSNAESGDTFTVNGGDAGNLARVMIP
tara:strand:- start:778 stop:1212 length:435 start_codon:yes stop_codon:yes gene_type:complete